MWEESQGMGSIPLGILLLYCNDFHDAHGRRYDGMYADSMSFHTGVHESGDALFLCASGISHADWILWGSLFEIKGRSSV